MVQYTALSSVSWPVGCQPLCESRMVTAVILQKEITFRMTLQLAIWPADLLLADVVLLPPAIGPTLGASFVSWALGHPLQRGGFSCTGPTVVYRDKSTG